MPEKRKCRITIFIPISILSDVPSLIEKTFKVGQLARSASIFRVDRIVIYKDSPSANREDAFIMRDLLSYAETPQYLRRRIFPMMDNLKYAGLIPPLRTPHHPLESTDASFREGLVLSSDSKGSRVDVGLKKPVDCLSPLTVNKRVTMKLVNGAWLPASKEEVPLYWGYSFTLEFKGIAQLIAAGQYDSVIATSRIGSPLATIAKDIRRTFSNCKNLAILFGSPGEGLHEILKREGARIDDVADLIVNTVNDQGTATIRTEEAVTISLAAFTSIEDLPPC
jgi:hypothetical protein